MSEALAAIKPPRVYYDGFSSLDGGINASANPSVQSAANPNGLSRNQARMAINCTFRGGQATHRPIYMRRAFNFPDADTAIAFCTGLFQGYGFHEATETSLLVLVGGHLYQIAVEQNYTVRDVTPGAANPSNLDYAWFLQAGPFTIIQDGSSPPIIFDGTSARRARPNEIKPGGAMAFSQGRIWYACKDQYNRFTKFRATDLIGGPGGTARYQLQDSVLQETENTFLNEGGDFSSRSDMGEIRAMVVPRMLDTSLGQGPLQVFCERGALSVNAPIDRTAWKNVTYPIATESVFDYGALGSCFASNANGDIIYRSLDGIRSFKLARADFAQWLNTGISMEVDAIIGGDPSPFLFYGSSVVFDNRYLATTWPRPTSTGFVHDGLVALDFNLISTLRQRAPAAWEGAWTGIAIFRVGKGTIQGAERCFAFARNIEGRTELWEILESESNEIWDNGETPIIWSLETPSYDFDTGQSLKRLQTAAIWREDVQEHVEFVYQFRPDQHPCYIDWHAETDCGPVRQCAVPRCGVIHNYRPQYRPKVRLPQPPDTCNTVNGSLFRDAYEFSFRLQITGHCKVKTVRYAAFERFEPFFDGCPLSKECVPLECCSPDPILYSSAPYHNDGSSGGPSEPGYPGYPFYPPPVYPGYPPDQPPCLDCGVNNPFVPPPPPPPPPVVQLPGVTIDPTPQQQPVNPVWVGSQLFFGVWTDPGPPNVHGNDHEIGSVIEPGDGLQDGTLTLWTDQLIEQFSNYVIANGLTVLQARVITYNEGQGATRRYFADMLEQQSFYISSLGLPWVLAVEYTV